jgi:outer membrane protein TolC
MSRLIRLLARGLFLVWIALPLLRAQPDPGAALPLPETYLPALKGLLGAAVSQSPRMVARNAENAVAEGNRIVARAGQLPAVSGYVQYFPWQRDERADLPGPVTTNRLGYNLTLSQPLYHWRALQNNTRMGELQLRMTQGQTAEGYRLLVQEIRGQYLQLVIRKSTLARTRLNLRIVQDNLAVAQTKFEGKVISSSDLFMPKMQLDQAQLAMDRATEDYESLKGVLARLCGRPALDDAAIPDAIPDVAVAPPVLAPMLAAFTSQPEPNSYVLRNLRDQIEVERLGYENLSTRLRPQLNFLMGVSQDQQSYTSNIAARYKVLSYFTGVQFTWSVFDGFATRGAAASSLARRRQLEASYRDAAVNLTEQARSQLRQLEFARRGMEIADLLLNANASGLQQRRNDAKLGLASEADVRASELAFADVQLNAYAARSDYLMKVADYLSTLLEDPVLANLPHQP